VVTPEIAGVNVMSDALSTNVSSSSDSCLLLNESLDVSRLLVVQHGCPSDLKQPLASQPSVTPLQHVPSASAGVDRHKLLSQVSVADDVAVPPPKDTVANASENASTVMTLQDASTAFFGETLKYFVMEFGESTVELSPIAKLRNWSLVLTSTGDSDVQVYAFSNDIRLT
jgi:hypothetical protein